MVQTCADKRKYDGRDYDPDLLAPDDPTPIVLCAAQCSLALDRRRQRKYETYHKRVADKERGDEDTVLGDEQWLRHILEVRQPCLARVMADERHEDVAAVDEETDDGEDDE